MFRKNKPMSTRKQEEKARQDPVQSHRPELPMAGPGMFYMFSNNKNNSTGINPFAFRL